MTRSARNAITEESGMAAVIAIVVLFILLAFVGASVGAAVQTNGSTRHDVNKKNALEAAEAGLEVATYRLNMLQPDSSHCIGDAVASPDPNAGNVCHSSTTTLGNGSTYTYYTTPEITSSSATCVGLTVESNQAISQRCITSVGQSNGITERSQIRVASFAAAPVFPIPGLTGLHNVTDSQNSTLNGIVASNGPVIDQNGATANGIEVGPGGSFTNTNQVPAPPFYRLATAITASPVDPGSSSINGTSCASTVSNNQDNCDYLITNGLNHTQCPANTPCDPSKGVSFNPVTRVLSMANNATLTLTGSVYNFCEFDAPNNATITLATGVHAAVYIDSPSDPNSGIQGSTTNPPCASGTGGFKLSNNVTWTNLSQDPTALQFYVYGDPNNPGTNQVNFTNNTAFWGVLFAPSSTIQLSNSSNNSAFWGAITGYVVNTSNNYHFNWLQKAGTLQANSQGVFYRTAWAQCVPNYTSGAPNSGCG